MAEDEPIAKYLRDYHMGEAAAVTSRELERVFHIRGPDLRREINRLRGEGVPICSFDGGYYYAETEAELRHTINQLQSRIRKMAHAVRGMAKTLTSRYEDIGQLSLLPEGG